jgi:hypothetical protein
MHPEPENEEYQEITIDNSRNYIKLIWVYSQVGIGRPGSERCFE